MLEVLKRIKDEIPKFLFTVGAESNWESLNIDYVHPHVHRLYMDLEFSRGRNEKDGKGPSKYRVYLHKLFPVPPGTEPLFHPHPWKSAIEIMEGKYKMGIGHSDDGYKTPEEDAILILSPGSSYDMSNEKGWHYVYPLDDKPVYSIMVTGEQFPNPITNEVWESISEGLKPLTYGQKMEMISKFQEFYKL